MSFEKLFDEQKQVFLDLLDFILNKSKTAQYNNKKIILRAPAGTGKTFVARSVMQFLKNCGMSTKAVAFTGRAASQLSRDGIDAVTCHSILYKPLLDEKGDLIRWVTRTRDEILDAVGNVLIVDEGSMIPKDMYDLFMGLNIPVVFLGDYDQLEPVDTSNPNFNVMIMKDCPVLKLVRSRRFDDESGIGWMCNHLRENNSIPRVRKNDLRVISKTKLNFDFHKENRYDVVICGTNKMRQNTNALIRKARGHVDYIPDIGETIVCLKNEVINNIKINNGEIFTVEAVITGEKISKFFIRSIDVQTTAVWVKILNTSWDFELNAKDEDNTEEKVVPFAYGYALSCHKVQGSSFSNVLFIDEDVSYFLDQRRYRYTGCSRAMNFLTVAY